jgi:hypothetical protein
MSPFHERSYLEKAVSSVIHTEDEGTQQKIEQYGTQLLRTAAFFVPGKVGVVATAGINALAQAKPEDSAGEQLVDASLGAAKGALLRGVMNRAGTLQLSPVETGVALGMGSRILDTGLNRSTYFDQQGNFDLSSGLKHTLATAVQPTSLAFDAATFGLASSVQLGMRNVGLMNSIRAPLYATVATGATMGFSTGAFNEFQNERAAGKSFDLGAIVREGAISSAIDGIGSVPGGALNMRASVPYLLQKGNLRIERESEASQSSELSSHQLVSGKVSLPLGGSVDVVVHGLGAENSVPMNRFVQNNAMHQLNGRINFENGSPEVAARKVTENGVTQDVWIQKMAGRDLINALPEIAKVKYGKGEEEDVARLVRETPELKKQLETAFYERLLYGDLDTWASQLMMPGAEAALKQAAAGKPISANNWQVQNIDADFSFLPHEIPSWSMKSTFGHQYVLPGDFAGAPISENLLKTTENMVSRYTTPKGQTELRMMGLTEPEINGMLSRGRWFIENRTFPKAFGLFDYVPENDASTTYSSNRAQGLKPTQMQIDELIQANKDLHQSGS